MAWFFDNYYFYHRWNQQRNMTNYQTCIRTLTCGYEVKILFLSFFGIKRLADTFIHLDLINLITMFEYKNRPLSSAAKLLKSLTPRAWQFGLFPISTDKRLMSEALSLVKKTTLQTEQPMRVSTLKSHDVMLCLEPDVRWLVGDVELEINHIPVFWNGYIGSRHISRMTCGEVKKKPFHRNFSSLNNAQLGFKCAILRYYPWPYCPRHGHSVIRRYILRHWINSIAFTRRDPR